MPADPLRSEIETLIATLPDDAADAISSFATAFFQWDQGRNRDTAEYRRGLADFFGAATALAEAHAVNVGPPRLDDNKDHNITSMRGYISTLNDWANRRHNEREGPIAATAARDFFAARLGRAFSYTFSDEMFREAQALINSLREKIVALRSITPAHKDRLLRRLEALQQELHPKMSSLDRLFGFIIDTSVVIKIVDENTAGIREDLKSLVRLCTTVVQMTLGLPSGFAGAQPLLPKSLEDESK